MRQVAPCILTVPIARGNARISERAFLFFSSQMDNLYRSLRSKLPKRQCSKCRRLKNNIEHISKASTFSAPSCLSIALMRAQRSSSCLQVKSGWSWTSRIYASNIRETKSERKSAEHHAGIVLIHSKDKARELICRQAQWEDEKEVVKIARENDHKTLSSQNCCDSQVAAADLTA